MAKFVIDASRGCYSKRTFSLTSEILIVWIVLIIFWYILEICIYYSFIYSLVVGFVLTVSALLCRQLNWIVGSLACMCDRPRGVSGSQLMLTHYLHSRHLSCCACGSHSGAALHSFQTPNSLTMRAKAFWLGESRGMTVALFQQLRKTREVDLF